MSQEPEVEHELSEEVFRLLRKLIYSHCGIYFDDDSRFLLQKRLTSRVSYHQLSGFQDYYYYLKYDRDHAAELECLVDVLTTNETYFFREMPQLRALSDEILPEVRARNLRSGLRRLRIWSAGCSTGEEPYTLAMLIREMQVFDEWDVEVFASDISKRVLEVARRGVYGENSFRATDRGYLQKYFKKVGFKYHVSDELKTMINFGWLNLLDKGRIKLLSAMDVILCRNVFIYFHPEARKNVVQSFYECLNDGGFLLLGHSESLMNLSTAFRLRHFRNDMVYQRGGYDPLPGAPGAAGSESPPETNGLGGLGHRTLTRGFDRS
ncbi:MAG: protein-glutamate O-methyltransferase CheR [Candidatus Schekmanbacteria bacterium]|nr:protein-glutamate O-methyltransferase CheR [Candidatus Schekmanbacteria bacterium]